MLLDWLTEVPGLSAVEATDLGREDMIELLMDETSRCWN